MLSSSAREEEVRLLSHRFVTRHRSFTTVLLSLASSTVSGLVKKLPHGYRIIVVSETDFAYWAIGGLRAAIVPGWEDKVVASFDNWLKPPHLVLGGTRAVKIDPEQKRVFFEEPCILGWEVQYEYLVVATVSRVYSFQAKSNSSSNGRSGITLCSTLSSSCRSQDDGTGERLFPKVSEGYCIDFFDAHRGGWRHRNRIGWRAYRKRKL
jgi:hypothetical protein